uniref:NF-kappa-B inhibitor epsilon n=2 Tax=Microcebus murinus TaxID=30608 RepID=A0A8C5XE39_MICMU
MNQGRSESGLGNHRLRAYAKAGRRGIPEGRGLRPEAPVGGGAGRGGASGRYPLRRTRPALRPSPALLAHPLEPHSPARRPLRAGRPLCQGDLQPGKAARRSPEPDPARTGPPRAGAAGMSEARKGPDEADESQCDSGIESLRSLRSLPEPTPAPAPGPSDGGGPQTWTHPPGTAEEPQGKEDADGERADSTYGSSSLTEPLSLLGGLDAEDPAPRSPLPPTGALSPQQLEALTYISEDGDTLVHLAVIHEAPAVLLCCLALLPQEVLDIQNNLYQTALHLAVHLDQPGAVRALVMKGASRVLQDRHGDTALHVACQRQHLACARCLLEGQPEPGRGPSHSLDLQLQNWQGLTCLHIATLQRNQPLMELLLQNGADIDMQEGTSGKTALHLAVETQEQGLVQFLIQSGARVDARMLNGCTPLHLAAGRGLMGISSTLCQAGADSLLRNVEDETPQDLAEESLVLLPFDDLKISGKPLMCAN